MQEPGTGLEEPHPGRYQLCIVGTVKQGFIGAHPPTHPLTPVFLLVICATQLDTPNTNG